MVGIFRQKNPVNNLLLFGYGLILKFGLILHSPGALQLEEDHHLYKLLLRLLGWLNMPAPVYGILAFVLLFVQAMVLNKTCNDQKMMTKPNFLPGMSFLLLSSLFVEWNYFSAPLIVNTLLIVIYSRMVDLYNTQKALSKIFNIGMLMGLATLFYQPAVIFVAVIPFALFVMRPFRVREWLTGILGITVPYYFLALEPMFTNKWDWSYLLPAIQLDFPAMPESVFITISIALLVFPFIVGGFYVQANLNKMLIQVRKDWSLLLIFLIISLFIILVNGGINYANWGFGLMPLAAFHAAMYFFSGKKLFPAILHWGIFLYALFLCYWHFPDQVIS